MTSYKQLYESQKTELEELRKFAKMAKPKLGQLEYYIKHEEKLDVKCPQCGAQLVMDLFGELYCKQDGCGFNKTPGDYWTAIMTHYNLEVI